MSMLHSLWKSYHIMGSDEDQLVVEDLYVGFDTYMRFVVTIEHVDNEKSEYSPTFCPIPKLLLET